MKIYIYAEHCGSGRAGNICHDAEEKYEDPDESYDLNCYEGTEEDIIEEAMKDRDSDDSYARKVAYTILRNLGEL